MSDGRVNEIRRLLDEDLSPDAFERDSEPAREAATSFFQDLFVGVLEFDAAGPSPGDAARQTLLGWTETTPATQARLLARADDVRVVFVELESLTRADERAVVRSVIRSDRTDGWATDGSFVAVFHAPDAATWHLVTPCEGGIDDGTAARPVLRRYTLGEGVTHRTVAGALADVAAADGRLAERIDEAFRVEPVREGFYEGYVDAFDTVRTELRDDGLGEEAADRYAHVTLFRLLFVYFLQETGWLGERRDFVRWFHDRYRQSADTDAFHATWLPALFFDGLQTPEGTPVDADLPPDVATAVSDLPQMNDALFRPTDLDERSPSLSDAAVEAVVDGYLERFQFTVAEGRSDDVDVAVDPSMLGRIYESLVAEGERDATGIFYTPRVEVDLTCRIALFDQLCDRVSDPTPDEKRRLVDFVFADPGDWNADGSDETGRLEGILRDLRIVDPACGGGAFLVGMTQVLTELYRKVDERPEHGLTERIVHENLHGVDVKGWAVRVAELRLWLAIVDGADDPPARRPVLPNLSFTLRTGDSLVGTVDGERLSLQGIRRSGSGEVSGAVRRVRSLKRRFFAGESDLASAIDAARSDVLLAAIDEESRRLEPAAGERQSVVGASSGSPGGGTNARSSRLRALRETVESPAEAPFLWELDFPEVMFAGGFDVVIGNPPYVRHREIGSRAAASNGLDQSDDEAVSATEDRYKDHLIEFVRERFGLTPYKRSDLYVYFYFKGLDLLRDGGTLSFVTSNSWLDANYGRRLQEGLLQHAELSRVVNNRRYRSFAAADVNTVITVAQRRAAKRLTGRTSFTRVDVPYGVISTPAVMRDVLVERDVRTTVPFRGEELRLGGTDGVRQLSVDEAGLWRLGGGSVLTRADDGAAAPAGEYDEGSWGGFVRAPDAYYETLARHGEALAPLAEVADGVRRGVTSGANDFFYLPLPGSRTAFFSARFDAAAGTLDLSPRATDVAAEFDAQGFDVSEPMFRIEHEYVMSPADGPVDDAAHAFTYTDGSGTTWVPNYLVKSPSEIGGLQLSPGSVGRLVLLTDDPKADLASGVREYVEWGEAWTPSRGDRYPDRPTCSTRTPWYDLTGTSIADVLFPERVWQSYAAPANPGAIHDNKNLYGIETDRPVAVCVAMNAATTWLFLEIEARGSLGEGVLDVDVNVAEDALIPIPGADPGLDLADVQLRGDLFEQIGAEPGGDVRLDEVSTARRRIDEVAMGEWLGMDEGLQRDVYEALLGLVGTRIERSESV